jgi:hypothetical protein
MIRHKSGKTELGHEVSHVEAPPKAYRRSETALVQA